MVGRWQCTDGLTAHSIVIFLAAKRRGLVRGVAENVRAERTGKFRASQRASNICSFFCCMNNMQLVNFILIYLPFFYWVQQSRQLSPPIFWNQNKNLAIRTRGRIAALNRGIFSGDFPKDHRATDPSWPCFLDRCMLGSDDKRMRFG